ncbi:uncharacterized protein LOC114397228 [Glycine soja]|uniref:uncharacterized protein LOC114397228 n=1 Tax=Glycine soja TaxID=3848 RepID=UPI00103FDC6D|nr:uncharacterized protein LOC114397228 [Glycine soja]
MNAKHLFNSLRSYGDLQEVVIPTRRNRMGKRFGFARFCRIQEPERFAMKLDNIFIGRDKLFANLPRYQRDQAKKMPGGPISKESEPVVRKSTQVWKPKVIGQACKITNGSMHDQMGGELKYEAKVEDMKRLSIAMVGVVIHPGQSYLIQEHFAMQGVSTILVTPLGANMVLLEGSVDDEDFQGYIEEAKGWLQQWFKEIKPRNASIVDEERLVWVRCYGVPSHVWDSDFFSFLTKDIGVFVHSDDNTMKRKTMDVARLMVRTVKKEAINMIRKVCINGVSFSIKMVEDWFGPIQWSSLQDQSKRELYNDENSSSDDEVWPESSPEDDLVEEDDEAGSYGNNSTLNEALIGISISNSNVGNNELNHLGPVFNNNSGPLLERLSSIQRNNLSSQIPRVKQRKLSKRGLLSKPGRASRSNRVNHDLKSISQQSSMNEAPVKSRTATEQASTHFSGGSVLCGGSLSSADMRLCNNKFWVLQSKSVAQRVWEEARHIGVEGTEKDEVYIQQINLCESRDAVAKQQRVNNNGVS